MKMGMENRLLKIENRKLIEANEKLAKDAEYWRLKYLEVLANGKK